MSDVVAGESVTLSQAAALISAMAQEQSLLLLSPPGVGKSDLIVQTAQAAGLACRSLLGTQIAPEDVSGIPRIVGERAVFCPPRVLLPEEDAPFCLFLDELPACAPDVQKAFYSLLLERRVGEYSLPAGSWVVAAGNRAEDRALVRAMSSALVNRVTILNVRVDVREWLAWAGRNGIRSDILSFILFEPESLSRPVPAEPVPFSTPRSWSSLSRSRDLAEQAGALDRQLRRALAFGKLSGQDAALFCAMAEHEIATPRPLQEYLSGVASLPEEDSARWFLLNWIRSEVARHSHLIWEEAFGPLETTGPLASITGRQLSEFLMSLPQEHRFALLVGMTDTWSGLGADEALLKSLYEVTGLDEPDGDGLAERPRVGS